jgi:hypothetical protein
MTVVEAAELYKAEGQDLHIYTCKGRKFFLYRPDFDIEEIAHATAMQCRYTGHVSQFYSVAEHSLLVARLMEEIEYCKAGGGTPFEGLLHDAHEAYISDIASPWKTAIPEYSTMEKHVEAAMRKHFELPAKISDGVKRADWIALFVEAKQILPGVDVDTWRAPDPYMQALATQLVASGRWSVRSYRPAMGKLLFLEKFNRLIAGRVPLI